MLETRVAMLPQSWYHEDDEGVKVIVPEEEAESAIRIIHAALGHVGLQRMTLWLKAQNIEIQNVKQRFNKIKQECEACAQKGGRKPPTHTENQIVCAEPNHHFSADVGHLKAKSRRGHDKFLVITDNAGGYAKCYPIKTESAATMIKCLTDYCTPLSDPQTLRTDNSTMFTAKIVEDTLQELGIQHIYSIPYKSQTNGVAERVVRSTKEWISVQEQAWDEPIQLMKLNQHLCLPHLMKPEEKPKIFPSGLQIGDQVWIKGRKHTTGKYVESDLEGSGSVHCVDGNKITVKVGKRDIIVHPSQLLIKRKNEEISS